MKSKSCRVALSALLHDLGKITQRAKIYGKGHPRIESNKTIYCPFHEEGGYYSHIHAACTAISIDELEPFFPDIQNGDVSPFSSRDTQDIKSQDYKEITDCLSNAAACHHKPDTFLQWCIAIADRIASGFEREQFNQYNEARERNNFICTELLTIFEQIKNESEDYEFVYPLTHLTPRSIFPVKKQNRKEDNAAAEYKKIWEELLEGIKKIPVSHRKKWELWLDHFDTLWLTVSHAVPSATAFGVKPEVSLYDHCKTTASLAVAIWRYHVETNDENKDSVKSDWEREKFLLIQGDFFGIQDFIFKGDTVTDAKIARLLRGRSFFVSLLCECAALKILDALELPSTSQIINAAGKFLIIAPNTTKTKDKLKELQEIFNKWFADNTLGLAGIGIASCAASPNDFISSGEVSFFNRLTARLVAELDKVKLQRMNLCDSNHSPVIDVDYSDGICPYDNRLPINSADKKMNKLNEDQIKIGELLAKEDYSRLLVISSNKDLSDYKGKITTDIFDYQIILAKDDSFEFKELIESEDLQRVFDISLPNGDETQAVWNGYSRRNINAYVPLHKSNPKDNPVYSNIQDDDASKGAIKSFDYISCGNQEDREGIIGVRALGVLKGDIDNLGDIFQGNADNFAKLSSLSRQFNNFFTIYLPWLCKTDTRFKDIYTVFAGGDDFYMIGPWYSLQEFAKEMKIKFHEYVACNCNIHFSAGYSMVKSGLPINTLSEEAEDALDAAKRVKGKNAFTIFDISLPWNDYEVTTKAYNLLRDVAEKYDFSTAYLYDLLNLTDMAANIDKNPENARWRALFQYRTRRMLDSNKYTRKSKDTRPMLEDIVEKVGNQIEKLGESYRIVLFNYIYKIRKQNN